MAACASCGTQNPDGFRLCGMCGAPLGAPVEARRQRRVVSVLFADLVGYTSRSERLDVEDVEAFLAPYHRRLREEVERTGGVITKFVGDGMMALFGAPVAHEDDPERAVRSGLAICHTPADVLANDADPLHVRYAHGPDSFRQKARAPRPGSRPSSSPTRPAWPRRIRAPVTDPHEPQSGPARGQPDAEWVHRARQGAGPSKQRPAQQGPGTVRLTAKLGAEGLPARSTASIVKRCAVGAGCTKASR